MASITANTYIHHMLDNALTFEQFMLLNARQLDYLMGLREEPLDAPLPEVIEPDPYHLRQIEAEQQRLDAMLALTPKERDDWAESIRQKQLADAERVTAKPEEIAAVQSMLDTVQAWEPPTPAHLSLKETVAEQLSTVLEMNTPDRVYAAYLKEAAAVSAEARHADAIEGLRHSIAYHQEEHARAIANTEAITTWLRQLRESLNQEEPNA